ncbi:hypothetical protein VHEMI04137 [[Torrubiella] hemipterigena]|uniref:tripeptidyl-peptidase II n=1 Tax=[Torrubiella] hemipterigena TaxID=1531966 RepID=A0A0A1SUK1_9HYPO|nr:hypothetical protein VHEMI04137 [[Torrubiella] hemipterigena]
MSLLLPALVATLAMASPLNTQMVTKQSLENLPLGWELKSAAPSDMTIDMHIGLKEENIAKLEQIAYAVSNPDDPSYGKHLSKQEIDTMTAPTKQTVDAVTKWLNAHGVEAGEVESGFLKVRVSVDTAQKMLNTQYNVYHNADQNRLTVRTTEYSVPAYVLGSISTIQPTTLFTDFGMHQARTADGLAKRETNAHVPHDLKVGGVKECVNGTTPACMRANYGITGYQPSDKTTLAITGFLNQDPSTDDLSLYLKNFTNLPTDLKYAVEIINNGVNNNKGTGEANLDTQIMMGLTYPIHNLYYSTGGSPPFIDDESLKGNNSNEPYLDWVNHVLAQTDLPLTISNSYSDNEQTVPRDYADKVCSQFMKLAARGVSLLISSGDDGVAGGSRNCYKNDGKRTEAFIPGFPPSCPWVTAVGGTVNYGTDEAGEPDGGGGFSNYYARPEYQKDQVSRYVGSLRDSFAGMYNKTGRAYPDISANYREFPIYLNGQLRYTGGTSAAAPLSASIIALLNDYRVANGKAPLGFLNPFLYKNSVRGIRDIRQGNNVDCHGKPAFPAKYGWDASTGLGVPDFAKLKKLL